MPRKQMNHAAYQRRVKRSTAAELRYTIDDARAAIKAQPDGENVGYYADEIHYAAAELHRRLTARD